MSPDHRFCYKHTQYAKAMAYMAYAFMRGEGFVLITGNPGTGKTTLVGNLLESLADENVTVGNLVSTQLTADDLLRMVAFSFGIEVEGAEKSLVLQRLTNKFTDLFMNGGRALLIVDEAQDLSAAALEELRLLTNLQRDGKPLLQIFLLGQSELRDLVHSAGLEQVHQRIVAASHLQPLKETEARAYVEHRLSAVGWVNDPEISSAVYPVIFKFSEGIPRRINLFCSRLFLHACVERRHRICLEDAKAVVIELQEEQLSTRNLLNDEMFFALDSFDGPLTSENVSDAGQSAEPAPDDSPDIEQVPEVVPEVEPDAVPSKRKPRGKKGRAKNGAKSPSKPAVIKSGSESEKQEEDELTTEANFNTGFDSDLDMKIESEFASTEHGRDSDVITEPRFETESDSSIRSESIPVSRTGAKYMSTSDVVNDLLEESPSEIDISKFGETGIDANPVPQLNSVSAIPNSRFNLDTAIVWLALLTAAVLVVYLME